MPRKKISEYRAKTLVNRIVDRDYIGWQIHSTNDIKSVRGYSTYVMKVDQAVKGRFKKGLVILDLKQDELLVAAQSLFDKDYESLLVEPQVEHEAHGEKYLSLNRQRDGVILSYSDIGGVDIEKHVEKIKVATLSNGVPDSVADDISIGKENIKKIYDLFNNLHISFLEINPYVIENSSPVFLDVAIEVDSSAEQLVEDWSENDVRIAKKLSREELEIRKLDKNSSASFSFEVINKNGSIFLLLSGGGASVVIADEIYTLGSGDDLANYGEYSGNPSEYETYQYTQQVLQFLLNSKAHDKVLFIGGAVANFTNIATTFRGVIAALEDNKAKLRKQSLKVYVRRGGPQQEIGLRNIEQALKSLGVYGGVYDPTHSIPDAVKNLIKGLS